MSARYSLSGVPQKAAIGVATALAMKSMIQPVTLVMNQPNLHAATVSEIEAAINTLADTLAPERAVGWEKFKQLATDKASQLLEWIKKNPKETVEYVTYAWLAISLCCAAWEVRKYYLVAGMEETAKRFCGELSRLEKDDVSQITDFFQSLIKDGGKLDLDSKEFKAQLALFRAHCGTVSDKIDDIRGRLEVAEAEALAEQKASVFRGQVYGFATVVGMVATAGVGMYVGAGKAIVCAGLGSAAFGGASWHAFAMSKKCKVLIANLRESWDKCDGFKTSVTRSRRFVEAYTGTLKTIKKCSY